MFHKNPSAEKFLDKRGEEDEGSITKFLLTVPKNFVEEPFCAVFQQISGSEKFMDKKGGGGVSKFSVENFLSQSAEKCRKATL